jgi:hypothetical protein
MGYTPLYDHMLSGTLYGRWPHTGIWACLLSRATREGVIDEVPASLAAAIGVPVDVLMQCIHDFMQPDPGSRTKDHDGRRLALIDPNRDWGWRVLNHGKYREKTRKKNYDEQRKESGENADRMRERRETREDPTRPAKTREDPPSEAEANNSKRGAKRSRRAPEDFKPDLEYARKELPAIDAEAEARKFKDWEFKTPRSDWEATWRNWISTCKERNQYARKASEKWQ